MLPVELRGEGVVGAQLVGDLLGGLGPQAALLPVTRQFLQFTVRIADEVGVLLLRMAQLGVALGGLFGPTRRRRR
jgi:hypothetical protein